MNILRITAIRRPQGKWAGRFLSSNPPGCRVPIRGIVIALAAAVFAGSSWADDVDFQRDVQPILARRCVRCHRPGNTQGDVTLDTSQVLMENQYVIPRSPKESELISLVRPVGGDPPRMPKEGKPLSAAEIEVLVRWIEQGAVWPNDIVVREEARADRTWWSLQPLAAAEPPPVPDAPDAWQHHPIDRFTYARLREQGLTPSPPADRGTLIRRVAYDLTGLPPTPQETARFVNDSSPDAYERLLDRLLASPAYGERWGRHWLDVIRFGESRGFERNEIINNLWPFRDYVIASFNSDKPFDRLVREHLAGDQWGEHQPQVAVGTAFLVCGPYDDVGNQDPVQAAQIRANTIDERIRTTTEAFLGLTVGCARCHHHKFDPILQEDYYGLYATLAGVEHGARVLATPEQRTAMAARLNPLEAQRADVARRLKQLHDEIDDQAEAIAGQVDAQAVRPAVDRRLTREEFDPIEAHLVRLVVLGTESNPATDRGYTVDEFEVWTATSPPRNVALAREGATAEGASRVANDFAGAYSPELTIDGRFGARWLAAGPKLTIRLAEPSRISAVTFSSDRSGDAGGHGVANFVSEYQILVSRDGKQWQQVASSMDRIPVNEDHRRHRRREAAISASQRQRRDELERELESIQDQLNALPQLEPWWVGTFRSAPGPFHVFLGGDPQRPGQPVVPASLSVLNNASAYRLEADEPEAVRRRQLAEWIVHPNNPLTARVLANRLWHYHFGRGIVATPSDFGAMGQLPTHPQLLDYLARQLQRHQWQLKPLHRLLMQSQTYRQAATFRADAARQDSDARYLWRFPPRRLSAEEIRDSMLTVAGQLDRRMHGPGFRLYRYLQDNVATYVPLDEHGPETYRRAVYHQNARASRVDLMTEFDCPDNAFATPSRVSTTTPLQALVMLNHQFSLEMAEAFARRLEQAQDTVPGQVRYAFGLAYGRQPDAKERRAAAELIEQYGLRAFCRALLNSNEFLTLD